MILKLRNDKIQILNNTVPEDVHHVHVQYDFEFDTAQLSPVLFIGSKAFAGDNIYIDIDLPGDSVKLNVYLTDAKQKVIKKYSTEVSYCKTCTLGEYKQVEIYKQLEKATRRIRELEEKGDII